MSAEHSGAPELGGLLETCLYYPRELREPIERFYAEALGLDLVARWDDLIACRLPGGMLLLFEREGLSGRRGPISAHGSSGPGHACLLAGDPDAYSAWQARLREAGVEITHEQEWPGGRRSFYFHDPAGNLLEIADGDMWPH